MKNHQYTVWSAIEEAIAASCLPEDATPPPLHFSRSVPVGVKRKCQRAVYVALKAGRLQRGPCAVCGRTLTEGHHEDYARPFDVTWLCGNHHRQRHLKPWCNMSLERIAIGLRAQAAFWKKRIASGLSPIVVACPVCGVPPGEVCRSKGPSLGGYHPHRGWAFSEAHPVPDIDTLIREASQ